MIQANELRVGNWVYDDNITLSKVIGFSPFGWSVRCDEEEGCELLLDLYRTPYGIRKGMMCESTKCEPIPLTPEILEKCGFNKSLYLSIGFYGFTSFSWLSKNNSVGLYYDNNFCFCECKYLHQLQNLYFALTGEELTFKP